jgi:hypothetical protein
VSCAGSHPRTSTSDHADERTPYGYVPGLQTAAVAGSQTRIGAVTGLMGEPGWVPVTRIS